MQAREPLYERALAIREKVLGPEHPDTARSLNNLAILLPGPGRLCRGAAAHRARAGDTRKGRSVPSIPIRRLASPASPSCSSNQGDLRRARPLYRARAGDTRKGARARASSRRRRASQPRHRAPQTRATLQGRGRSSSARWRYAKRHSAPSILHTASSLNNLAHPAQDQGDLAGARPLFERALAIREKVLGPEHPDTATSLNNLAYPAPGTRATLRGRGRSSSARWRSAKRCSAPSIPTRQRASTTSRFCSRPGRPCRRAPLFERALAIARRRSAPSIQTQSHALQSVSPASHRSPDEALTLGETALAAHDKILGRDHAWTKDSARVTADALDALGRTEEAKALRERYGVTEPEKPKAS